jgi:hypothetical protein
MGSLQPSYIILPAGYDKQVPAPLMVALHTWDFGIDTQRFQEFEQDAERRIWIYLAPEFRGVDDHPACRDIGGFGDLVGSATLLASSLAEARSFKCVNPLDRNVMLFRIVSKGIAPLTSRIL